MSTDRFVPAGPIPEMEPEKFANAIEYAHTIASGEVADQIPDPSNLKIEMGDGDVASLANIGVNRFGMAAARHFGQGNPEYRTFMWRWMAMGAVVHDDGADQDYLIGDDPETVQVHTSVVHAAAQEPLGPPTFLFESQSFWDRVRQVAASLDEDGPKNRS